MSSWSGEDSHNTAEELDDTAEGLSLFSGETEDVICSGTFLLVPAQRGRVVSWRRLTLHQREVGRVSVRGAIKRETARVQPKV